MLTGDYLAELKKRSQKSSRISRKFQLVGLEISQLLNDPDHKALYIKLAKEYDGDALLAIAKDVAERTKIENKGGYFMKVLYSPDNKNSPIRKSLKSTTTTVTAPIKKIPSKKSRSKSRSTALQNKKKSKKKKPIVAQKQTTPRT